ncbi:uncharacterized protein ACRADG_001517 [Cochliomyia hominivorax]
MLLNSFAQPTLLSPQKTLNFEEFQEAPLLLSHKNALDGKHLPRNWCGNIYGTEEMLNEIINKRYFGLKHKNIHPLTPNVVHKIKINDDDYQGRVKDVDLILIPWVKEYVMYLIKADNVTNLITDMITENMEVFVQNKTLRENIKMGIDVLYINDGVYSNSSLLKEYPAEDLLGSLATLVKPRYIQGLLNDRQLPIYVEYCCAQK